MLTTSCSALTGSGSAPPPVEDAPADGAPKASASCAELSEEALAVSADCAAPPKEPKEDPRCLEKKRCMNFYKYLEAVELEDKSTWKDRDLETMPMIDLYKHYKLDEQTIDFLGHAVALHIDDDYLT